MVQAQARGLASRPLENMAMQLDAMLRHDVSHSTGGDIAAAQHAVTARVLVVASPDDLAVTPHSAMAFARAIGADTLVVPSTCGHQVFSCERARTGAAVRPFLAR